MGSIFKTILGIFLSITIIYCGLGIIWANNDAIAAESYLHTIGNEISAGNLQETVITDCQEQARDNGYELTYHVVKDMEGYTSYVVLTLEYDYSVSFASLSGKHTKTMTVY